jgi:nicotinate-nucleotide--dimethylbenzimidazole phosphoribosyltransferase
MIADGSQAALASLVRAVLPPSAASASRVQRRLDQLTKPPGSLGRLEQLAAQLSRIYGDPPPALERRAVIVMVADHGVSVHGVSAYPREVTAQMCANFEAGGAAVCVMAPAVSADVHVADVGVDSDVTRLRRIGHHKIRRGSRDFSVGRAMTLTEARAAILTGARIVAELHPAPAVIAIGEMGIGNTTSAAAIVAALTHRDPDEVVGPGTGVRGAQLARKAAIVRQAVQRIPRDRKSLRVLGEVGGFDIAAMVGAILETARTSRAVIIDGFISTAAALVATRLCPAVEGYLVASHLSPEPGHQIALDALGLRPALHLEMRLGEGTGALLMLPILDAAGRMMRMATFDGAGVSTAVTA